MIDPNIRGNNAYNMRLFNYRYWLREE